MIGILLCFLIAVTETKFRFSLKTKKNALLAFKNSRSSTGKKKTPTFDDGLENDFVSHHRAFTNLAGKIHKHMLKTPRSRPSSYENLRQQLLRVSRIYKKKYPQCLPPPMALLEQETAIPESSSAQQCKLSFTLGYNFALNWMKIFRPVNKARGRASVQLEESYENSKVLHPPKPSQKVSSRRIRGDCFAKGISASFQGQFAHVQSHQSVPQLLNPRAQLRTKVAEMRRYIRRIQKRINKTRNF